MRILTPQTYTTVASASIPNPAVGGVVIFADTDNKIKQKDNAGNVVDLTASSSGISRSINNISTNTTAGSASNTDYIYIVTGSTTVTLPTCVSNTNQYTINNDNTDNTYITVACSGAENIMGETSVRLYSGDSLVVQSDGTQWRII